MVIKIPEIEDEIMFSGTIDANEFESPFRDVDFSTPVEYSLKVHRSGKALRVQGYVHCGLSLVCARCLERFSYNVDTKVDFELVPKEMAPKEVELELERDDLDVHYYESEELDIIDIIQEEVILSIPMRAICKEDCKGLCERCGGNRNLGECKCDTRSHTRLGELLKSYLEEGDSDGCPEKKAVEVKKR